MAFILLSISNRKGHSILIFQHGLEATPLIHAFGDPILTRVEGSRKERLWVKCTSERGASPCGAAAAQDEHAGAEKQYARWLGHRIHRREVGAASDGGRLGRRVRRQGVVISPIHIQARDLAGVEGGDAPCGGHRPGDARARGKVILKIHPGEVSVRGVAIPDLEQRLRPGERITDRHDARRQRIAWIRSHIGIHEIQDRRTRRRDRVGQGALDIEAETRRGEIEVRDRDGGLGGRSREQQRQK